jgi:hypothetical protein
MVGPPQKRPNKTLRKKRSAQRPESHLIPQDFQPRQSHTSLSCLSLALAPLPSLAAASRACQPLARRGRGAGVIGEGKRREEKDM